MSRRKTEFAILGAGNGGQAIAGHLAVLGHNVNLYDISKETIDAINRKGFIEIHENNETKCGYLAKVTTNIEEAIAFAEVIMVVNPAIYHGDIALACAPYIKESQMIFLHPGSTFGAFAFKKALKDGGCKFDVPIAESNTLIYACRAIEPGNVIIGGVKERILVATLPAKDNHRICRILKKAYPQVQEAKNVLVTSLDNTNPIVHPAPTLLSTSWVESGQDFLYYYQGISPSIGKFIVNMDKERIEIGKALGLKINLDIIDIFGQYDIEYNVKGDDISNIVKNVIPYAKIIGPHSLKTRYIYEDILTGLVPLVSLGKQLGVCVEMMEHVIWLSEKMLAEEFASKGRTLKNLGLDGMTTAEIIKFAEDGIYKKEECASSF